MTRENRFRKACYRIKDKAINGLLRHGSAYVCTLEISARGSEIGIAFVGGGRLHTKPSGLDMEAQNTLRQQLIAVINGENNGTTSMEPVTYIKNAIRQRPDRGAYSFD